MFSTKRAVAFFLILAALIAPLLSTGILWAEEPRLLQEQIPHLDRPWSNDADKFSFAIIGDKTSGGEGKWPIFDRAVDALNLLDPDFAITVGDMIPGHMEERAKWDEEWAEYMAHANRIEVPLFFTVGNHDIANTECYEFWKEDFGRTYYSFDYKDCHFLVLNTEEERFDGRGPVWQAMMQFAETDLAAHTDSRHTFLFFHKPMWDDPRFLEDWQRIENALHGRRFTAVAGHEHYQMTERRNGNLYVVQSATGGGIRLSDVKEYGCFHSFGFVTVDGDDVRYALVEPEGGIWPVDIAPASFRRAIVFELVQLDAAMPEGLGTPTVTVHAALKFHNVLPQAATVGASIAPIQTCGWTPIVPPDSPWRVDGESATVDQYLAPDETATQLLTFEVPSDRLPFPPAVRCTVEYDGNVLSKENRRMEEVDVVPIHPKESWKAIPAWQLVGPFPLGPIDTSALPADPLKANPNFYRRFGPEDGYDPGRVYEGDLKWHACEPLPRGLLNFNALMGTLDHAAGYALCGVYSPHPQLVHAAVYADNFFQVFVNRELVEEAQGFGAPGGFVYVPVHLQKGWNTVIAKLINNRADWFLRFLIADPQGNLRLSDHPPAL